MKSKDILKVVLIGDGGVGKVDITKGKKFLER
jgi:hypothetical protein